jgi:hypothetical protein
LRSGRAGAFYAEAWALVHCITLGRKNPVEAPIGVYLETLAATGLQDEAFKAAFGVDVAGMDRELQEYIKHYSFQTLAIPRTATTSTEPIERLAEEDARQLEAAILDGRHAPEEADPEPGRAF